MRRILLKAYVRYKKRNAKTTSEKIRRRQRIIRALTTEIFRLEDQASQAQSALAQKLKKATSENVEEKRPELLSMADAIEKQAEKCMSAIQRLGKSAIYFKHLASEPGVPAGEASRILSQSEEAEHRISRALYRSLESIQVARKAKATIQKLFENR